MANIFGFIIHPMELGLIWLANTLGNAGIAIIVFTIFVRLVLSPLNIAQLRNAKAMQRLQPMLQELRKKHGKDKQALSQATMGLYKEHNVNPAMGCLPTLLQFPILIGLFYALNHLGQSPSGWPHAISYKGLTCGGHSIGGWTQWLQQCYTVNGTSVSANHIFDLFHANFLWLNHGLGEHDPYYILPLLAGVTQWVQSRMMLTRSSDPQQQMMNNMMNFMPLLIIFFALRYASGLPLYWVTSTLIGILIQYRITGWGLLPETLGGIFRTLGLPGPGGAQGPGGGRQTPKRPSSQPSAPKQALVSDSEQVVPADGDAPLNGNGTGGNGTSANGGSRPRRKPKSGKGGGKGARRY